MSRARKVKTNADYRRRYKRRHPGRVKKQDRANYVKHRAKKLAQAKARHERNRDDAHLDRVFNEAPTPTQEAAVKVSPESLQRARDRFALHFRRAVLERIDREHKEKLEKPVHVLNAERDALIETLAACGRSVAYIADAVRVTVKHVRTVLSIAPKVKPSRPVQLELLPMEGLRHG